MIGDIITPAQRLSRLSPNRWEHRLSLLFFVIAMLLCLALMCENVNAAPQANRILDKSDRFVSAGAAPFMLSHPLCATGFTIAMRYDTRNASGTIIKSVWVRKCTKGKIIYGGKI